MINFKYNLKTNIRFGIGERKYLNNIILKEKFKAVCVVIDKALVGLPMFIELMNTVKCATALIECDISEPTYENLEEKRKFIKKENFDAFIGIGGGSAMDMAKGLSVLYTNKKSAILYRGFEEFNKPIKPIIAIPTTAGTGSEITPNASFVDTLQKKKMGINGNAIRPIHAILDPELTISCPKQPTISAGVDSLVHATEAYVAKNSNKLAKMFAKEGFNIVFENLPLLITQLNNIELRQNVMYGSFLSSIALMHSGTGPAAAMSYPLGVHFGVPHGIGGGIFLPYVIKHNIDAGFFNYADIIRTKNCKDIKYKSAKIFLEQIRIKWKELEIPNNLKKYGMGKKHIGMFKKDVMELKSALNHNPVPFAEKEISNVLRALINNN